MVNQQQYAGFWIRFAAYLIDSFILSFGMGIFVFLFTMSITLLIETGNDAAAIGFMIIMYILITGLSLAYYILMPVTVWQGTIGKKLIGLKIVDADGNKLTIGRSAGRTFSMMISGMTMYIGYIMAGFTDRKQALHDMIAKTYVIQRQSEWQAAPIQENRPLT
ncbi:RDD family protein [Metabacillus mangrovi]|nr:RDD family protein [Metabacillus mangrovi]